MKTKHILIGLGITALAVGGFFGIRYYKNKKREEGNKSTEKQFEDLVNAFSKSGKDTFQGIAPERYKKTLDNFLKNISRQEADELIKIAVKKESEMTVPEKAKLLLAISKMAGVTKAPEIKAKSAEEDPKKKELATGVERSDILLFGKQLYFKTGKHNWISSLSENDYGRSQWSSKWKEAKPTMYEYNLMRKFLTEYDKNETETFKKFTNEERIDLKKVFTRLQAAD